MIKYLEEGYEGEPGLPRQDIMIEVMRQNAILKVTVPFFRKAEDVAARRLQAE
jgi:hypothetical protein